MSLSHGERGHLWQERFHSFLMDEDYLLATGSLCRAQPGGREIMPTPRRMALVKRSRAPGRHRRQSGHRQTHARSRSRLECLSVEHLPERQDRADPSAQSNRTPARQCRIHPGPRATNRQNPGTQTPRPQTILNQLGILSPELPVGIACPCPRNCLSPELPAVAQVRPWVRSSILLARCNEEIR
jgi:hypothetical protein